MQSTPEEPKNDNLKEKVDLEEGLATDPELQRPDEEENNLVAEMEHPAVYPSAACPLRSWCPGRLRADRGFRLQLPKLKIEKKMALLEKIMALEEKRLKA
ncbi:hypothetical protein NDU88_000497 [Pleurodeles waltl]|uniref:Uncharacterized protein n=1 Tax=Pleurodeles waltl TaxID=8319 RepID=A0AAV7URG2_PLEWA|nr:hypothetical protein NDU88_000497 [Pleurodeles waltl]